MQTFICDRHEFGGHGGSFDVGLRHLDDKRLGKQRLETKQIYTALTTGKGWVHHPATKMWKGFEEALLHYGIACCQEWKRRGHEDTMLRWFTDQFVSAQLVDQFSAQPCEFPDFVNYDPFIEAHRSNLIRKDAEFYGSKWPDTRLSLPYLWPKVQVELNGDRYFTYHLSAAEHKRGEYELWPGTYVADDNLEVLNL
ncbi:hypothetical protein BI084_gp64 [Gordonia phage Terapin]|uniref:Uncharacterized protein n=5 Tax=Terapinvirus terapin TaxID=2734283 RepID=A0A345MBA3_9CAUD|nr:hypothetical protein BI084_gp64 [Gordonia phage Terapin]AVP43340.1 hypothetical protein PBI_DJOKOVIC_63 [Gordonia phage Djokovic]AXH67774.1 hypothetical protein SEA_BEYONCAGE_63 [Gordonia phage Beyoncage]QOC56208.1 hypothetical protein SEA_SIENNA_63 [Gordonia phage Sienna]QOC56633.1 hypothetical protein SEA_BITESIZE_63 [Gordonia phage BiteSize]QYW00866.1 hypothetical protein SEA_MADI_63 [Gordonia phage Madi]